MWKGIFKSYSVVEVIPVTMMTEEDWRLLDWDRLRNKAKNRIAEKIEGLAGFAMIRIFDKARTKPAYLLPLTRQEVRFFEETGEVPFGNESDDEFTTDKADQIDDFRDRVRELLKSMRRRGAGNPSAAFTSYLLSTIKDAGILDNTRYTNLKEALSETTKSTPFDTDIHSLALLLTTLSVIGYSQTETVLDAVEDSYFGV